MKTNHLIASVALAILPLGTAFAAAYTGTASESFDYTAGSDLRTQDGGTGFNGAWGNVTTTANRYSITEGSLTHSNIFSSGNKLTLDGTGGNAEISRSLSSTPIDAGTFYFGFLLNKQNVTERTLNMAFFDGGTERFAVGQFNTSGGNLAMNVGGTLFTGDTAFTSGTTFHLVVKIEFNVGGGTNDRVSLFVNPGSTEPGVAYLSTQASNISGLNAIRPFAGGTSGSIPAAIGSFDELRVGTSFADVSAIPEPASFAALAGLGVLGLAASRRRRA